MRSKIELSFALLLVVFASACPTTQAEAQDVTNSLGGSLREWIVSRNDELNRFESKK